MKIAVRVVDGVLVLKLQGRLTLDQIAVLEESVREHLEKGQRMFVVNLLDVTDLSSSGIAKVIALQRVVDAQAGKLLLAEPSPVCDYVLDLAGLTDYVKPYRTETEAVQALRDRR